MITLLSLALSLALPSSATPEKIDLGGSWGLGQRERGISVTGNVPGIVQADLRRAGKIPDPFYRDNEKAVQWISDLAWTYSRSFNLSPEFVSRRKIVLRCEGLDTLATIWINGRSVAETDNMFRTWEFDAKPFLHSGENQIKIEFQPIEPYMKARETQAEFPGKAIHGWGYIRKAPFQQGWDFAPKLMTVGIWKPISLVGWSEARLTDVQVIQDHSKAGQVEIEVKATADSSSEETTAIASVYFHGKKVGQSASPLKAGVSDSLIQVIHPHLWWPNGMGGQDLYEVRVKLVDGAGKTFDTGTRRIGLRIIKWFLKTDHSPLTISVNGRQFYAKGSNWIPRDSMINEATPARERTIVEDAVAAHMNLVRLWGGGYYESDSFYDACDEKGLLVWFEFKYADSTYPAFDPKWLANVRQEAVDNVRRVRHHPSIAIYSGNNEVIGFIAEKADDGHMSRADYNTLFHTELRDVVHELEPEAAYTPGSPEIGDDHDWDVWHGSARFNSYLNMHGFFSEFGFQAFPGPDTIRSFTQPEDRASVGSPVMKFHQRNWRDGNQLILRTMERGYGQPKDFDSTLWLSQIQQADGIRTGVEHWRRDWPNSSGSLVWQLDDCWPSISWSMIDYYGRPKALYYQLKKSYAPVALSGLANDKTGKAELWVVNDRAWPLKGKLDWTFMRTNGQVVSRGEKTVSIPEGTSSVQAANLDHPTSTGDLLLWGMLRVAGEPDSKTVVTFDPASELKLVDPQITSSVKRSSQRFEITLSAQRPALWAWIELPGIDAKFSDNFVALRPGEPTTITVTPSGTLSLAAIEKGLRVRSLFDTYVPGTVATPVTHAGVDGKIVASADKAEILGDNAILETFTPNNIGNWTNVSDFLRWRVEGAKAGSYRVTAVVSIPTEEEGSTFEVEVDGSRVSGTVPGTGAWTTYREIDLGTLKIRHDGTITITLKPTSKPKDHVMNLRSLRVTPSG